MSRSRAAASWTGWIVIAGGAFAWFSQGVTAETERLADPVGSVSPSSREVDSLGEVTRRIEEAVRSFTSESVNRDERAVQAAWGRYLERMRAIRADVQGMEMEVAMRIHRIEDGRLVLESPQAATGALRLVVGRPAPLARAGSSAETGHEADDLNYVLQHLLFRGIVNQTPPQQGAG